MAVVKYSSLKREDVKMDGVTKTTKANVIGPLEGWKENTLRVFRISPGGSTAHHQHDWEHVNHIIKGQGVLLIGENTFDLFEGDFAYVPPNAKHQFRNPHDEDFEFICIVPNRGA